MTTTEGYALLPIEDLHESSLNPRRHFDAAALKELAMSIAAKGILTPLLVRPNAKGFEIGAGHRRLRAAKIAGLGQVPAVVRDMSDADFLELIVVENDQREDVHPLEQADGYKRLMLLDGYDAKRIADRIGRSEKWVYDRMKLLQLSPLAQKLFLAGRISAGHAILLARLTHEQQALAIGEPEADDRRENGGLFEGEYSLFTDEEDEAREKARKKDPLAAFDGMKAKSVRELDAWIAEHIRFDAKKADPFLFPQVVAAVTETPKALVPITRNHYVQEEARDGKVRTYGPASWKRADGTATGGTKDHACQYAVGAIVVVGPGRGETFSVCLSSNRDRCAIHWKKEKAEAERRAKQRARSGMTSRSTPSPKDQEAQARQREKEQLDERIRTETETRIGKLIFAEVGWPLQRRDLELIVGTLGDMYIADMLRELDPELSKKLAKPASMTPAELARATVGLAIGALLEDGQDFETSAKLYKVDRKKIEAAVRAELEPKEKPAAAIAKPKKKAAKK